MDKRPWMIRLSHIPNQSLVHTGFIMGKQKKSYPAPWEFLRNDICSCWYRCGVEISTLAGLARWSHHSRKSRNYRYLVFRLSHLQNFCMKWLNFVFSAFFSAFDSCLIQSTVTFSCLLSIPKMTLPYFRADFSNYFDMLSNFESQVKSD